MAGLVGVSYSMDGSGEKIRGYKRKSHLSVALIAGGGSRTHTPLRTMDFESIASAIPPLRRVTREMAGNPAFLEGLSLSWTTGGLSTVACPLLLHVGTDFDLAPPDLPPFPSCSRDCCWSTTSTSPAQTQLQAYYGRRRRRRPGRHPCQCARLRRSLVCRNRAGKQALQPPPPATCRCSGPWST